MAAWWTDRLGAIEASVFYMNVKIFSYDIWQLVLLEQGYGWPAFHKTPSSDFLVWGETRLSHAELTEGWVRHGAERAPTVSYSHNGYPLQLPACR